MYIIPQHWRKLSLYRKTFLKIIISLTIVTILESFNSVRTALQCSRKAYLCCITIAAWNWKLPPLFF
ncbi:unnamed protein product [Citrullus colocynthis]|uniref:Uncharacterized protein n=1 Tax=Citrullus colocynthis TaxID=252529 RepID=A0ABP0Z289_9ROSI